MFLVRDIIDVGLECVGIITGILSCLTLIVRGTLVSSVIGESTTESKVGSNLAGESYRLCLGEAQ
jgi:hypothetical protein